MFKFKSKIFKTPKNHKNNEEGHYSQFSLNKPKRRKRIISKSISDKKCFYKLRKDTSRNSLYIKNSLGNLYNTNLEIKNSFKKDLTSKFKHFNIFFLDSIQIIR